jgi:general secretion pathway protein G
MNSWMKRLISRRPAAERGGSILVRARRRAERGFTLIELLVVVAIIGILTTAALPTYRTATRKAKEAVLRQQLFAMRDVIDQYFVDKGHYPTDLNDLVDAGYLRKVPFDPIVNDDTSWVTDPADPDPSNPDSSGGIKDVHSSSTETALNGSSYSEW